MDTGLQNEIIQQLKVKPHIHPQAEIRTRVNFLKEFLEKNHAIKGFVLGISGGQDSTLVAKLAQIAINEKNRENGNNHYKFIAVRLPYGVQVDERDCQDALVYIQPNVLYRVNIKQSVDASVAALRSAGVVISDFIKGNEKARERMKVQYSIAAVNHCVVLGTNNSAEFLTGYFTKHGDGACDLEPIFGLNKRQGKELLKALKCPSHLYLKRPTADLEDDAPNLEDEISLGVTYEEIDDYLEGKVVSKQTSSMLEKYFLKSEHKRKAPKTIYDY
ncbi:ammonia-dependent NAD(+) synthetase [Bacillus aquiflavi]|uniref:NH(3)-dependent NAD(+) synthetase n=1 Tax=Bacillus aquiflavi TaxID=2672567 RepID=A0A6B3W3R8_9BACI|nr:ammonia-dependent NAD(+) synthetase [Bacillus aquiflavi]MBA4538786.1 ammonia-dependent NAD(+) synthetase [Bacillus aquiflavi]NEY83137.1 ammonia-dependent NAD(+) synthetase [Bacillus aquiflavi]UAC49025.1 ammonia-dependent NAD(+) synthetase [Bacillus aquiflavi]